MRRHLGLAAALALAGCGTTSEPPAAPLVPQPPVVVDSFCQTAVKRRWSIHDTAETIREAEAWNRAIDRRCGVPGR